MARVSSCFGVLCALSSMSVSVIAQDVCLVTRFKMRVLSGYVLDAGPKVTPVRATKLELLQVNGGELVETEVTDERGSFRFDQLNKGTYLLATHFLVNGREVAPRFDIVVKVTSSGAERESSHLEIRLGPDCFVSNAQIKSGAGH